MPRFTNNMQFFKVESQQDREYFIIGYSQGRTFLPPPPPPPPPSHPSPYDEKIASQLPVTTAQLARQQDIYIIAIQNRKGLAKSKSWELESSFHAMKLGDLRLNLIQNVKHLKNRIKFFQIGIIFVYFVPEEEIKSYR